MLSISFWNQTLASGQLSFSSFALLISIDQALTATNGQTLSKEVFTTHSLQIYLF